MTLLPWLSAFASPQQPLEAAPAPVVAPVTPAPLVYLEPLKALPEETTVAFIGRPAPGSHTLCEEVELAKNRPAAADMDDATHFDDRYSVLFDVLEVLKAPSPRTSPLPGPQAAASFQAYVAFPNAPSAFHPRKPASVDCAAFDAVLAQPYVVVFAFPIYIDHGNSMVDESWDVGTDARMPNRGFASLHQARRYVAKFRNSLR